MQESAAVDPAVAAWLALPEAPATNYDEASAATVIEGVRRGRISQVYLYDEAGSRLYDEICKTPDYYLTSKEEGLLRLHAAAMAGKLHSSS